MKNAVINLLKVKSIVTVLLTCVVCYLAVIGKYDLGETFVMIISFYFGTQYSKREMEND